MSDRIYASYWIETAFPLQQAAAIMAGAQSTGTFPRVPAAFLDKYQGPQFGVGGTRTLSGVFDRPLIGTIIKPSVGLSPAATAGMVDALAEGGIDFIKDDELQADGPHCPFDERLKAVMRVIDRHADASGKKVMYAVNITGEIDEMLRRHDAVAAAGGSVIMWSVKNTGLPGLGARGRRC